MRGEREWLDATVVGGEGPTNCMLKRREDFLSSAYSPFRWRYILGVMKKKKK